MANHYCLVIPHYRHVQPLLEMCAKLVDLKLTVDLPEPLTDSLPNSLPIYVVDDASPAADFDALAEGLTAHPQIELIKRPGNGGKGAAMMTGLNRAAADGYSHAISMDADGQHNIDDMSALIEQAELHPQAIIAGRPVFGDDIPASRLYGRMLTNTLVKAQTASSMIKDAMCGFRIYPLTEIRPLFSRIGYRTRMEFDVELLVRAHWAGIDIHSVDTRVVYPEHGASHFNMFADNVRLVAMHIILIVGGILRLPEKLVPRLKRTRAVQS